MAPEEPGKITELLGAAKQGSIQARSELADLVYDELRRIARGRMRGERPDHLLQPTALVHEAYIQLLAQENKEWQNRAQFYAVAAQIMRRILIDYARTAKARKRGGDRAQHVTLDFDPDASPQDFDEVLALDSALQRLEKLDPRQSRVVELRYFGGMTEEEVAEVLNLSARTVKRDWNMARTFLKSEMTTRPAS